MIKIFFILLPPYANEFKIWKLLGKWVYWVWVRFYPKTHYFLWVFHFLKPYPPNPLFWVFLDGFDGFFGFTQPMYTHSKICKNNALKKDGGWKKIFHFLCRSDKHVFFLGKVRETLILYILQFVLNLKFVSYHLHFILPPLLN